MRQFSPDRIWSITHPERGIEVFCDVGTEVYRFLQLADLDSLDPKAWPDEARLFRDYWNFFADRSESNGPYFTEVLESDRTIIKEYRK